MNQSFSNVMVVMVLLGGWWLNSILEFRMGPILFIFKTETKPARHPILTNPIIVYSLDKHRIFRLLCRYFQVSEGDKQVNFSNYKSLGGRAFVFCLFHKV